MVQKNDFSIKLFTSVGVPFTTSMYQMYLLGMSIFYVVSLMEQPHCLHKKKVN
jgi:hypothetical protein